MTGLSALQASAKESRTPWGLVAAAGHDAPAAYATVEAEIGGFDDRFLPSIAEFQEMYEVLHAQDELYRSSTHGQGPTMEVDALDFGTSDRVSGPANYDEEYRARPIRAF